MRSVYRRNWRPLVKSDLSSGKAYNTGDKRPTPVRLAVPFCVERVRPTRFAGPSVRAGQRSSTSALGSHRRAPAHLGIIPRSPNNEIAEITVNRNPSLCPYSQSERSIELATAGEIVEGRTIHALPSGWIRIPERNYMPFRSGVATRHTPFCGPCRPSPWASPGLESSPNLYRK
jgi:hypothetical protein